MNTISLNFIYTQNLVFLYYSIIKIIQDKGGKNPQAKLLKVLKGSVFKYSVAQTTLPVKFRVLILYSQSEL